MLVDTVVFHSPIDGLSQPNDVKPLLKKIGRLRGNFQIHDYSHLDFCGPQTLGIEFIRRFYRF